MNQWERVCWFCLRVMLGVMMMACKKPEASGSGPFALTEATEPPAIRDYCAALLSAQGITDAGALPLPSIQSTDRGVVFLQTTAGGGFWFGNGNLALSVEECRTFGRRIQFRFDSTRSRIALDHVCYQEDGGPRRCETHTTY